MEAYGVGASGRGAYGRGLLTGFQDVAFLLS